MFSIKDIDYEKSCFVDMPYGKKQVADKEIDFEWIYTEIFAPAIEKAELLPYRCKDVYDPRPIHERMFLHTIQSIMVLADITGDNPNVMIELGVRLGTDKSGTVLVGQHREQWIYDIVIFPIIRYQFSSAEMIAASRKRIFDAVNIAHGVAKDGQLLFGFRKDINDAMGSQERPGPLAVPLYDAYRAMQSSDWHEAAARIAEASQILPGNALLHQLHGVTLRADGRLADSSEAFQRAIDQAPSYVEAFRELGITAARKYGLSDEAADRDVALNALQQASKLGGQDARTMTYLGGILEKDNCLPEALEHYRVALEPWSDNLELRNRVGDLQERLSVSEISPEVSSEIILNLEPQWRNGSLLWNFRLLGLDEDVSSDEVTQLFSEYGTVSEASIRTGTDAPSQCEGLVQFGSQSKLGDLTDHVHNTSLHGRTIKVSTPGASGALHSVGRGGSLF